MPEANDSLEDELEEFPDKRKVKEDSTEAEKNRIRQEQLQRKKDAEEVLLAFSKVTGITYQMQIKGK